MMTGIGTPSSQSRIPRPMMFLPCIEPAAFSNGYAACPVNAGRGDWFRSIKAGAKAGCPGTVAFCFAGRLQC